MKKFVEVSRGVYRDPELPVVAASTGEWKQWSEKGWQSKTEFFPFRLILPDPRIAVHLKKELGMRD